MQIKTYLIFHLTPVQMIKINKTSDKCWQVCGERETIFTVGVKANWYEEYSKYLKTVCYDPDVPYSVCSQRTWCSTPQVLAQHYSLSLYSRKPENRNKLNVLQQWTDNEL